MVEKLGGCIFLFDEDINQIQASIDKYVNTALEKKQEQQKAQEINDKENDFYIILEDDITFCDNFKKYLGDVCKLFVEQKLEHLALGEYNTSKVFPTDDFKIEVYSKDLYKSVIIKKSGSVQNLFRYLNNSTL